MQVHVHHVDAHVAGPHDAEQRVQVRAVAVDEPALRVHDLADLGDVLLEQPERVRVRDHQRGHLLVHGRGHGLGVQDAVVARRDGDDLVAVQRRARGVRAVRGVGHEHARALLAARLVVRADHHDARELALRAGGGLERHAIHAADLGQQLLERVEQGEQALHALGRAERMCRREAGQARDPLVQLGVVLHRAGAEGIEAEIDRRVPGGEACEVADDVHLRHLGQARQVGAGERPEQLRDVGGRDVGRRHLGAAAAGPAALEQQRLFVAEPRCRVLAQWVAPASRPSARSIDARDASSVAQNSTAGPSAGACGARSRPATTPASRARARARSAGSRKPITNSLNVGAEKGRREAHGGPHPRLRVLRLGEVQLGELAQPTAPEQREVDRRHEQAQALVRADVRRRPLAADVLLARRERQHEAAPSLGVHGLAGEASGQLPHVRGARRQEAHVRARRSSSARRSSAPRRTRCRRRARRARSSSASESASATDDHQQRARARATASAAGLSSSTAPRKDGCCTTTQAISSSSADAGSGLRPSAASGTVDERDVEAVEVRLEHLAVVRVQPGRDDDLAAAREAHRHQRRLGRGRCAVVHRRVRHLEAGERADQRLPLEDRLQRALADLGLVRRVGGGELGARDQRVDRAREVVRVAAGAEEPGARLRMLVLRGERGEVLEHLLLAARLAAPRAPAPAAASRGSARRARRGLACPMRASIRWTSSSV